jgi:hypothetical protein
MITRQYPKNIFAHPNGLLVRVIRDKVLFQASVPKSHPAPLARAIELRDKFLSNVRKSQHPKSRSPHRTGTSNTGIPGISESTNWIQGRPYSCFNANWSVEGRRHCRKFYYKDLPSRDRALKNAIQLRHKITGIKYA